MSTLLRIVLGLLSILPLPINQWMGRQFGVLNDALRTRAAKVTRENLQLCLPDRSPAELQLLVRESLRHTGMTAFETPSVWLGSASRKDRWIGRIENECLLDRAMSSGRGTVVLLPHLGNWEMFNAYFARKGEMTALYQPPRQEWLKPMMKTIRGDNLVATDQHGLKKLFKVLKSGGVVTVLPDQVPTTGEYAPFFGHEALTDRLVPRLLAKTNAQALMCIVYREQGKFNVRFSEPESGIYDGDIARSLEALNRSIEISISDVLVQYQWEYKRFRERPAGEKRLYKFGGQPESFHL